MGGQLLHALSFEFARVLCQAALSCWCFPPYSFITKAEQQVKEAVSNIRTQITADQQSLEAQLGAMEAHTDASLQSLQVGLHHSERVWLACPWGAAVLPALRYGFLELSTETPTILSTVWAPYC